MLDLQKLTLGRLLNTQNHDFYSKLVTEYFTGMNLAVFDKIKNFYKANTRLPTKDELLLVHKDVSLQEYIETQIFVEDNTYDQIADEFLVSQLQDHYIREETLKFLDKLMDDYENLEKVEIVDKLQDHVLQLNKAASSNDELFDAGELDFFPKNDDFILHPSGLNNEYDSINGGFALQELVLLGGRRGSGKSILSLNCALKRFLEGSTVAFFSIEMRYKEVYDRLISIISEVPFLAIYKNELTPEQKLRIIDAKINTFYEPTDELLKLVKETNDTKNFDKFQAEMKDKKFPMKEHRFFLIDKEDLTLSRLDHYCTDFASKYPRFNMAVVDYINIIKIPDQKEWKSQIVLADTLKSIARKHNLTVLSPYQIDASGEARFAKGILDSADRSFIFTPADVDKDPNILKMYTSKIRNGKAMNFEINMDWSCVKVDLNHSKKLNESLLPATKYGSDENFKAELAKDI